MLWIEYKTAIQLFNKTLKKIFPLLRYIQSLLEYKPQTSRPEINVAMLKWPLVVVNY